MEVARPVPLLDLPPELIACVLAQLDPRSVVAFSHTCRAARALEPTMLYPHRVDGFIVKRYMPLPPPFKIRRIHAHAKYTLGPRREYFLALAPPSTLSLTHDAGDPLDWPFIAALPALTSLNLHYTGVNDADLAAVAPLIGLTSLNLSFTSISGAGLKDLAGLTALTDLDLMFITMTDADLAHLAPLTGLRKLDLSWTAVTNTGLPHLAPLTGLRKLELLCTAVTDAGLTHLAPLTNLKELFHTTIQAIPTRTPLRLTRPEATSESWVRLRPPSHWAGPSQRRDNFGPPRHRVATGLTRGLLYPPEELSAGPTCLERKYVAVAVAILVLLASVNFAGIRPPGG